MKKMNNKGFSLVELIIVIAIMAILAGAIAPALIRYIDKSRKSNDVSSAKTIKTAIETALGNETIYEYITTTSNFCYITVTPGEPTSSSASSAVSISNAGAGTNGKINGKAIADIKTMAEEEIGTNIGEKTPKLKYRKNASGDDNADDPAYFVGVVSKKGTVYVFISTTATFTAADDSDVGCVGTDKEQFQICPNICDEYQ